MFLKILLSSFLITFFIFAPALSVKSQWTVGVMANWSPTEIIQVQNSTNALIEEVKQGVGQMEQIATGHADLQVKIVEFAKTAARWAETVTQYTNEIFQMARQFTSLKGILGMTMQKLGLDSNLLKTFKEWATALYAIVALKQQYENLWSSRMSLFKGWWMRAKNGIFNPNQDWLDLQNYFIEGLGKREFETQMMEERMRLQDREWRRWEQEIEKYRAVEAELQTQISNVKNSLKEQSKKSESLNSITIDDNSGSASSIEIDTVSPDKIKQDEQLLSKLQIDLLEVQKEINLIIDKMQTRYTWYYLTYGKMIEEGDSIVEEGKAYDELFGIKFGELGKLLDLNLNTAPNDNTAPAAP